jgi:hypothetical protein
LLQTNVYSQQKTITSHEVNLQKLATDNKNTNEKVKVLEEMNQELGKLTFVKCKELETNSGQIKTDSVFPQVSRTDRNYHFRGNLLIIRNKLIKTKSKKKFTKPVKRCAMFHKCAGAGNTKPDSKGKWHSTYSSCPMREEIDALKLANENQTMKINQGIENGK